MGWNRQQQDKEKEKQVEKKLSHEKNTREENVLRKKDRDFQAAKDAEGGEKQTGSSQRNSSARKHSELQKFERDAGKAPLTVRNWLGQNGVVGCPFLSRCALHAPATVTEARAAWRHKIGSRKVVCGIVYV